MDERAVEPTRNIFHLETRKADVYDCIRKLRWLESVFAPEGEVCFDTENQAKMETVHSDPLGTAAKRTRAEMSSGNVEIIPVSDVLGAEVTGVDAVHLEPGPLVDTLRTAFRKYHLLVFRGQDKLTQPEFHAFAGNFGEIEKKAHRVFVESGKASSGLANQGVHLIQNLDAEGKLSAKPYNNANFFWHSDKAYYKSPSFLTMLHAVELPPSGGDTEFANMVKAYEALSPEMKERIKYLQTRQSYAFALKNAGQPLTEEEERRDPPENHPIVRVHPDTGEKSLFIGMFCTHIVGMDVEEGRELLKELLDHAGQPRFVYRHVWRVGDVVMWDNRFLLHRATRSYEMEKHRRTLRRCVVRIRP